NAQKPKLTLDDFFNAVGFDSVEISPDGHAVVIGTERADWDHDRFRKDLWLYRDGVNGLTQLTQSGHDSDPQWSPDGQWIAFLSERKVPKADGESDKDAEEVAQLYIIPVSGGEAFPVTQGEEEVHAFSWAPDSRTLYFATRVPWTKAQKDAYKKDWKDVKQYRDAERGDMIFSTTVADAIARRDAAGTKPNVSSDNASDQTPGSRPLSKTPWRIQQIATSLDGRRIAFVTSSISERSEKVGEFEIYSVDLAGASADRAPKQLTHNEAVERALKWANDNKHLFFQVELGSAEGPYKDTQQRLYWVDADTAEVQRWASDFSGEVTRYGLRPDGSVIATGRTGTEVQLYSESTPKGHLTEQAGLKGTYEVLATSTHSPRVAFVHSTIQNPTEVYLADSVANVQQARPITAFNKLFTERDLPMAKPYQWTADDGTRVEGMLMYPPGRFEAKNLPMFVHIHGGPADADGNHFEADWYQ